METATIKDLAQTFAWLVASIGGVVAAFKAVVEMRRANEQRVKENEERQERRELSEQELRWRKAEMSKRLIDALFADRKAVDALDILDYEFISLAVAGEESISTNHRRLAHALRTDNLDLTKEELHIRTRFDALLHHLRHIEHYISIGLILESDMKAHLSYYVFRCIPHKATIDSYSVAFGFESAKKFLNRFKKYASARQT